MPRLPLGPTLRAPALLAPALLASVLLAAACGKDPKVFVDGGPIDAVRVDADPRPAGTLPTSLDLGTGDCGAAATTTFTVTNSGGGELTYQLTSSDPWLSVMPSQGTILAGTSTTFTVRADVPATATAGQALAATLTVTSNLPDHATVMVPVRVTPRGATVVLEPPSLGFGQLETGTSAERAFTVRNTGDAPAMVTVSAPGVAAFTRSFGTAGVATVAAGGEVTGAITFGPTAAGATSSTAPLVLGGAVCGAPPSALALSGEGVLPGGVLVQGIPVDFGAIDCGSAVGTRTFTLVNTAQQPSPFTIAWLTDPQGDDARYQVSPDSGTLAPGATQTITVTRLAIALPATPRAYDATLRVHTTLPAPTDVDVDVRQGLRGPVLTASTATIDFGFAPTESTETTTFTLSNTGNAPATVTSSAPLHVTLSPPAMLAAGATSPVTIEYLSPGGAFTGSVVLGAVGACSGPVTVALAAGTGPYALLPAPELFAGCPPPDPMTTDATIENVGNQPLTISCAEQGASGLAPVLTPSSLTVAPGTTEPMAVEISPGNPVRSGATTATMRCQVNQPLHPVLTFQILRQLDGADIVLSAPAPLEFVCNQSATRVYTTANVGTQPGFLFGQPDLVYPLEDHFTIGEVPPGDSLDHVVEAYPPLQLLLGIPDPCAGGGTPGDIAFQGSVGAGGGSGAVCSVTPASLPVILRYGNIAE